MFEKMKKDKDKKSAEAQEKAAENAAENVKEEAAQDASAQDSGKPENENAEPEQDEAAKLKAQLEEQNDKYVRLMAEFDNYRRRTAKERLELIEQADKDVLLGFLPVVDDCERALDVLRKSDASEAAIEGTELIFNKLMSYLKSKGITLIEAKGTEFNTDLHEAVAQFPAPSPEMKNKVIDVTENGYMLRGKVIRFAKVVVGI